MKRFEFLFLISLLCPTALYAKDFDARWIAAQVEQSRQAWDVPGLAVVVVQDDKIVYLAGHGVREKGKCDPVTENTLFPLASCSKSFTAALLAILVDEGKMGWDDPIQKHLDWFRLSDPLANKMVTLRDLTSHRTGLNGHDFLWYRVPWSQEESIRRLGKVPLNKPFRTAMQYQSITYMALGHAITKTMDRPWYACMQERLLDPLEMKSTCLDSKTALQNPDHASGHQRNKNGQIDVVSWYDMSEPNSAGSVCTSAQDLANWLRFHLADGQWNEQQIVSKENLDATKTPETIMHLEDLTLKLNPETQQMSYAMGWVVQDYRGQKMISHGGMIDGFRAHITLLPKQKMGVAILSNLFGTRMNFALSNRIVDEVLGGEKRNWDAEFLQIESDEHHAVEARNRRLEQARRKEIGPTYPLEKYVGTYEHSAYGMAKISLEKEQLIWEWSRFRCPLEHFQADLFRIQAEEKLDGYFLRFQVHPTNGIEKLRVLDVDFRKQKSP